jgi:hypothetical protein
MLGGMPEKSAPCVILSGSEESEGTMLGGMPEKSAPCVILSGSEESEGTMLVGMASSRFFALAQNDMR